MCVCVRETEKGEDRERRSSQTTANFRSNGLLRDPIGSQGGGGGSWGGKRVGVIDRSLKNGNSGRGGRKGRCCSVEEGRFSTYQDASYALSARFSSFFPGEDQIEIRHRFFPSSALSIVSHSLDEHNKEIRGKI